MTAKRLGAKQPSCYSFTDFLRSIVQPSNLSFSFLSNFGGARRFGGGGRGGGKASLFGREWQGSQDELSVPADPSDLFSL